MISHCLSAEMDPAYGIMKNLCDLGYSATDIITTLFRVVRNYKMQEFLKLEFIKVCRNVAVSEFACNMLVAAARSNLHASVLPTCNFGR